MEKIYQVWHFRISEIEDFDWDNKKQAPQRLGVYSSEQNAQAAVERLHERPEFAQWPDGFRICECFLDNDSWVDGFVVEYLPDEG